MDRLIIYDDPLSARPEHEQLQSLDSVNVETPPSPPKRRRPGITVPPLTPPGYLPIVMQDNSQTISSPSRLNSPPFIPPHPINAEVVITMPPNSQQLSPPSPPERRRPSTTIPPLTPSHYDAPIIVQGNLENSVPRQNVPFLMPPPQFLPPWRQNSTVNSTTRPHLPVTISSSPAVILQRINLYNYVIPNSRSPNPTVVLQQLPNTSNVTEEVHAPNPVVILERLQFQVLEIPPPIFPNPVVIVEQLPPVPVPLPHRRVPQHPDVRLPPRRRHAIVPHRVTYKQGLSTARQNLEVLPAYNLGMLNQTCQHCQAIFFQAEIQDRRNDLYICCKFGTVRPPPLSPCPPELYQLFTEDSPSARQFRTNIRSANSSFAMASFKATLNEDVMRQQGHSCFSISGQVYHYAQPLPQPSQQNIIHNQLYFVDVATASNVRTNTVGDRVPAHIIQDLHTMLQRENPFIRAYRTMKEVLDERDLWNNLHEVLLVFKENINTDLRRYNLPESRSDIAAIFTGEAPPIAAEFVVYPRDDPRGNNELKNLNRLADPMVYPLLFPHGEHGFDMNHYRVNIQDRKTTFRQFYCYRIQMRRDFSILHHSAKLFQQYLVDAWCKIESNNMWYYRDHQKNLRSEQYTALRRHVETRAAEENARVGRISVLPAQCVGSPRYMNQRYLDAMATVARHGNPHLFITMTTNPTWPEISNNLQNYQKWEHRPDLVCRVFQAKLKEFLKDLVQRQIWGVILNYTYTIEFQKRGLPHAHILVTLRPEDAPLDADAVDTIISAMLPNLNTEPHLFAAVIQHQVHKPCGSTNPTAPCMKEGKCSKYFPKSFCNETRVPATGPVVYKRPFDGRTAVAYNILVDNSRIVPYNPWALMKFKCHMNFEACTSFGAIRYLYKYICKGTDCITVKVVGEDSRIINCDEINTYLDCRYVSSMEAAWKILGFSICGRSHSVLTLTIHDRNRQRIYYQEGEEDIAVEGAEQKNTMLLAWFALNRRDIRARQLHYWHLPDQYVWNRADGVWQERRQVSKTIGTLAEVSPADPELFYLRMLLVNVVGKVSFDDLLTVDGVQYQTYYEVCERLHLVEHTDEYDRCLREAALYKTPARFRRLFALICCVAGAQLQHGLRTLWENHVDNLILDYIRRRNTREEAMRLAYTSIVHEINRNGGPDISMFDFLRYNENQQQDGHDNNDIILDNGSDIDDDLISQNAADYVDPTHILNEEQLATYNTIVASIIEVEDRTAPPTSRMFFVDGPGGTGKTFLYNALINNIRSVGKTTVAVAWTGIAATLLKGGTTAHRAFKLPLTIFEDSSVGWPIQAAESQAIKAASVIVWDEAPMTPKVVLAVVDRYLRDLMEEPEVPMGGKVFVLGGDFRQTLPIVPRGHRTNIVQACIKCSPLWRHVHNCRLTINMRTAPDQVEFSQWLNRLGDGKLEKRKFKDSCDDLIEIPAETIVKSIDELLAAVFEGNYEDGAADRAVLCPTNAVADLINASIVNNMPGHSRTYYSVNMYDQSPDEEFVVTDDVLTSLTSPSLPPHTLVLKAGTIVMLLRNLDVDRGLCNGTRLQILDMKDHVLLARLLTGNHAGEDCFIPKLKMTARDTTLPKPLVRLQFPVRVAYALTINKSQGQTFKKVGICLRQPCFSHGQLYVAFSRATRISDVKVYIERSSQQGNFNMPPNRIFTRNVVYTTIIDRNPIEQDQVPAQDDLREIFLEDF